MSRIGQQYSQYVVLSPLGSGGMGDVYIAEDGQLKRKAALKFLSPELSSKSDHLERFLREARAASALNHPNICTIYEINSQFDTPFIAMEYIEGETVSSMIRRRRRNSRQAIEIAIQVCSALADAHLAGIVHRDIKPANIIVTARGQAKILDFGLVKLIENERAAEGARKFLTQAGIVVGTASYMSPEQARGLNVDGRTDVWSLGVVLYEMITGELPFSGETSTDTLAAIITKTPVPPSQISPDVTPELEKIVLRSLEADRAKRYESADAMLADLKRLRRHLEFGDELERVDALRSGEENTFLFENAPTEVAIRNAGKDTASAGRQTSNLRRYFSPIVGRRDEIAAVSDLLRNEDVRLLTLTGIGGTGKTRLAHAVAESMLPEFPDSVFLIELASVSLPELVPTTIAQPLGVRDSGERPLLEALKEHLAGKRMLLVLDNFEQVIDAAPVVAELLSASEQLKIVVTSRILLNLTAEREFAVPPLAPPDARADSSDDIKANDAVRLFTERARSADRNFDLSEHNARDVAEICTRLEGLPLAIELAGARVRVLSPAAILLKLESRLKFLTGGARDLPERQRTMQGAIDWSYDLLGEVERIIFRRLSIFTGSFSIEAAEAVCGGDDVEVIDSITSLLDKSLLIRLRGHAGGYRFGMLEVVREYAAGVLADAGEDEATARTHATYFLELSETAEPSLQAAQTAEWFDRLEDEHDNLRSAMQWTLNNDQSMAVRLAVALRNFWLLHSHLSEGYRWLKATAESSAEPPPELRFKLMNGLGLASRFRGDLETARKAYADGLAAGKEAGDKKGVAISSRGLGLVAMHQGDGDTARKYFESGLEISRELGDKFAIALSLSLFGDLARTESDFAHARPFFEEALALFRELDNKSAVGDTLNNLGATCFGEGDLDSAKRHFTEAANLALELGNNVTISYSLDGFAALAIVDGDLVRAAVLSGAAEALRESIEYSIEPAEEIFRNAYRKKLREQMDASSFSQSFERGRALSPEEALGLVLEVDRPAVT